MRSRSPESGSGWAIREVLTAAVDRSAAGKEDIQMVGAAI
jgi:hypothetical protein